MYFGCVFNVISVLAFVCKAGLPHVGISTYFREFLTFVGCRENLREK